MQTKETVQEYEHERNEVSYPENVGAEGGTSPHTPYIEITNQTTTRHQPTKGEEGTYKLYTGE